MTAPVLLTQASRHGVAYNSKYAVVGESKHLTVEKLAIIPNVG